jgi:hypothetical protein
LHRCDRSFGCVCPPVDRVENLKYLGVSLDERLTYKHHISSLTSRIWKTIYVMKGLRRSAPKETLLMVYKVLCQSAIIYCIRVWGAAAKSTFMEIERAQLKVMLKRPFRYCTDQLYKESNVLRVRQLFILRAVTAMHKFALSSPDYEHLIQQRVYKIPIPSVRTSFAKRQAIFRLPRLYNILCRKIDLRHMSTIEVKRKTELLLYELDYMQTETLVS